MTKANEKQFCAFIRTMHSRFYNQSQLSNEEDAFEKVSDYANKWLLKYEIDGWMLLAYEYTLRILEPIEIKYGHTEI